MGCQCPMVEAEKVRVYVGLPPFPVIVARFIYIYIYIFFFSFIGIPEPNHVMILVLTITGKRGNPRCMCILGELCLETSQKHHSFLSINLCPSTLGPLKNWSKTHPSYSVHWLDTGCPLLQWHGPHKSQMAPFFFCGTWDHCRLEEVEKLFCQSSSH